ncbi:hypothetical protein CAP40_01760 [Sphingomonas sp. IBVSS2]|uniref:hypothetical protein n=1 Tax=Sphingomonas sp. IBVSS2 TaxID=1985172 RepID=UPI000A2DBD08|nr:hypothetical protein [Sphingomonas sp. IBVSS2]OSZ69604.1 hypothetical protein CAP40_01760 [Sphingomonas sp. IBVSS2]
MDFSDWHVARARALFSVLAERHGLRMRGADAGPDYLELELPVQYGLRIALKLVWARDMLMIRSDLFTAQFHLDADPEAETSFVETLDGLVTGAVRLHLFYWPRATRPYKTLLQRAEGQGEDAAWRTVYTWFRWLPWSPIAREEVFVNSRAPHLHVVGHA